MNALATVFPHAIVLGCLFHLGQSLWRRVQNESLSNLYRDDENIKRYSKMLIALSFVPSEDVGSAFDELNDSRPDNLQNVYDYWELWEDNYVGLLRFNR
jgi:hypothetical protein